jgi:hypothetical protein
MDDRIHNCAWQVPVDNSNVILALVPTVTVLLLVAGTYAWKSIQTLRRTTQFHEMLPDERQFQRRMAWRRLVNSALMILLAAMIAMPFTAGMHQKITDLGERREQERREDRLAPLSPEERDLGRFYVAYWIVALLLLGVVVGVAGLDLMATRLYGVRKLLQIQTERRAMIERQLRNLRKERDELDPPD